MQGLKQAMWSAHEGQSCRGLARSLGLRGFAAQSAFPFTAGRFFCMGSTAMLALLGGAAPPSSFQGCSWPGAGDLLLPGRGWLAWHPQ